jgi:hypothetical protein
MDLSAWLIAYPRATLACLAVLVIIVLYQGYILGWFTRGAASSKGPQAGPQAGTAGAAGGSGGGLSGLSGGGPSGATGGSAPSDEIKELTKMVNS